MVPEPLYLLSKNPELIGPTVFSVQTLARVVFQICNFGTFLGEFFWGVYIVIFKLFFGHINRKMVVLCYPYF
jgi:hypothetical protein